MPPKPKFTKEEIIAAALELVSEKGIEALTARELGVRLGSSARPIFTVFHSMEEVQKEVREAALKRFESYAEKAMDYTPLFKQVGMQMIFFAMEQPKLYQLVYMSENAGAANFGSIAARLGDVAQLCVDVIRRDYGLSQEDAQTLFEHVWIYTFGIGVLCATGMCRFSQEEILQLLGQDFMAMLFYARSGRLNMPTPVPRKEGCVMKIETERLILRELTPEDCDSLYAVLADSDIMQHYPYIFDEARVRRWIVRNIERYEQDGFGLWAVVLKETGEMIGDCGITLQNIHGTMLPEIGYHIRKDQQRKGYASEAAEACIRYAFEKYDFPAVYSYMKYTNIPSQRTAMKNGLRFVEEYEDPDNIYTRVYAITREEWEIIHDKRNKTG